MAWHGVDHVRRKARRVDEALHGKVLGLRARLSTHQESNIHPTR